MSTCTHVTSLSGLYLVCGSATDVRRYLAGFRCPTHTPAALRGRPEPGQTASEYRPTVPPPMGASALVDNRAIASGKRRSTPERYREAQVAVHKRAPLNLDPITLIAIETHSTTQ